MPTSSPRLSGDSEVVSRLPHDIYVIDTGFHRPRFDASYLLVDSGRGAFIDTGTTHSLPRLLQGLDVAGLNPEAVDWVVVTHVHLDHAGGASALMQALPNARLVVHPRGATHMIDPSRLLEGARAVYGADEVARAYGRVDPIAADRVVPTQDGMSLSLGKRPLLFIDTPGHARHHHGIWDARSRGFFTGDTFGLSYREFDTPDGPWIFPTTTPVQFEPDAMRDSVRRIMGFQPDALYLTHYGPVQDVPRLGAMMLEQIDAMVALGHRTPDGAQRHAHLKAGLEAQYFETIQRLGSAIEREDMRALLAVDIELNAQGLGIWLDKMRQPPKPAP